jgi:hypothetical protein
LEKRRPPGGLMRTVRPFFIVGSPRSGTTLLQAMLASAPGLFIPPETHFFEILRRPGHEAAGRDPEALDRLIEDLRKFSCEVFELPVTWDQLEPALRAAAPDWAAMFDALLYHMQQTRPAPCRIGEKTPSHILQVEYILERFADAQVITIVRDGRDVVTSNRETFGSELSEMTTRWRDHQREHARLLGRMAAARYTSVRYEDLVTQPEGELRRLCAFLGEPFVPAMLAYHQRRESGFARFELHKLHTLQPLTDSRIGRYRSSLSRAEVARIEAIAGPELMANRYVLDTTPGASLASTVTS